MKRISILLFMILLIIIAIGCSKNSEQDNANDANKVELTPSEKTDELDYHIYPLTGEKTGNEVSHRAIAVSVSNQTQARPQSGLSKADIVFEMLTEGNIT